jgi:hypothetical protein
MREIRTSGLMSGERKRDCSERAATAPFLELYRSGRRETITIDARMNPITKGDACSGNGVRPISRFGRQKRSGELESPPREPALSGAEISKMSEMPETKPLLLECWPRLVMNRSYFRSTKQIAYDLPVHVREPEVAPGIPVRELLVVES